MYINHTEFILDAPFVPPQSCLRSSYMYTAVDEARFAVKQWCRTYSQLLFIRYAADMQRVIIERYSHVPFVRGYSTYHYW